jgi:hypothetical protein
MSTSLEIQQDSRLIKMLVYRIVSQEIVFQVLVAFDRDPGVTEDTSQNMNGVTSVVEGGDTNINLMKTCTCFFFIHFIDILYIFVTAQTRTINKFERNFVKLIAHFILYPEIFQILNELVLTH